MGAEGRAACYGRLADQLIRPSLKHVVLDDLFDRLFGLADQLIRPSLKRESRRCLVDTRGGLADQLIRPSLKLGVGGFDHGRGPQSGGSIDPPFIEAVSCVQSLPLMACLADQLIRPSLKRSLQSALMGVVAVWRIN